MCSLCQKKRVTVNKAKQMSRNRLITHYRDEDAEKTECGGKAYGLIELKRLSAKVPAWFSLNVGFFESFVEFNEIIELEATSILAGQFSEDLLHIIKQEISQLPQTENGFAVRSSMLHEDGRKFSFAGQLLT